MERENKADAMAAFATVLSDQADEALTTQTVVDSAVDLFDQAEHASVTLRTARRAWETVASTSDLSAELDRLQYTLKEGPCVDSTETGDWHRSGDIGSDPRWPNWGPAAAACGMRSMLSIQLLSNKKPFGALNIYSSHYGAFVDRDEVEVALLFTVHAAAAMASARLITNLETAMTSRHEIGVAQGFLMGKYELSAEQAWAALQRVSQHQNIKLREVAAIVMKSGRLPGSQA